MLGWFAQRVLGQYDLLVPDDPAASGDADADAVYYVGANILGLEKRFAFRPRDFRLWIAIHECTHRAQFTAVPWLKPYFLSLVDQALGIVDPDPKRIVQSLVRAGRRAPAGSQPARRRRPRRAAGVAGAARRHRAGAVAHVGARGSRQPRDERGRPDPRRRPGPHGPRPRLPPPHARHAEHPPQALRSRREDAPVRGRRGVRHGRRERSRPARARPRLAGPRVAAHGRGAQPAPGVADARRPRASEAATVPAVDRAPDLGRLAPWRDRLGALGGVDAPVVVACSGGADSLALLAFAADGGLGPVAVHVDHGIRSGSAGEAEFVAACAASLGATFHSERVVVTPGPNLEARARAARYDALDRARAVDRRDRGARRAHGRRPGRDRAAQPPARECERRARRDGAPARRRRPAAARATARRHARGVRGARVRTSRGSR